MIIEEADFRLESVDDSTPLFDLELLHIVNKGKSNERSEFKVEKYGLPLESALKCIAIYRLNNKNKDGAVKAAKFLKDYMDEIKSLKQLFDGRES
jgi:hypothetical protein